MTCVIEKPFANMHFEIALTHIWKMRNANFQETRPSIIHTISENSRFTRKKRSLISKSDVLSKSICLFFQRPCGFKVYFFNA